MADELKRYLELGKGLAVAESINGSNELIATLNLTPGALDPADLVGVDLILASVGGVPKSTTLTALSTSLEALTHAAWQVDNIRLDGNTVSTTSTNGDLLLIPNGTGKVGVATATPAAPLHVNGDITTAGGIYTGGSSSAKGTLRIDSNGNATLAKVDIIGNVNSNVISTITNSNSGTNAQARLYLYNDLGGSGAALFLCSSGYVGGYANAAGLWNGLNGPIKFATNNIVRVDITAAGDINNISGSYQTNGITRIDANGNGTLSSLAVNSASGVLAVYNDAAEKFRISSKSSPTYYFTIDHNGNENVAKNAMKVIQFSGVTQFSFSNGGTLSCPGLALSSFMNLPSVARGTPSARDVFIDETGSRIAVFIGGAWKYAALT
jgi:hypothetical protein